ncbi:MULTISPECIES: sulfatase-like hydrolase/transferase [unclassified Chelatococcus]|uniref:sulfatase-like hydrolase/transferase n=1 Tax=unclassified Chelatococcus TaxID=2638111 RepID=UPI001BD18D68|nr:MULTISPECIES: sulfatase-like hydrolase/transferase [unclassified Chelatococcus]MBS7700289.1 sulfatase-like hydrolase/transferase [Chelatococcus sp. YT9]MBX3558260.1 sulfatase-like hydrolase/transferase [Chelatococcus sp.]
MNRQPPNIVVLIADDHRYESIGCNGNSEVETPNLDGLAQRGVTFDGAHCQGGMHPAVCVPSRASFLTGRNIFASAVDPTGDDYEASAFAIPAALETFPQRLRAQGYVTHAIGKWHNDKEAFARSFSSGDRLMFGGMSDHDRVPLRHHDPDGYFPASEIYYEDGLSTDLFRDSALDFLRERSPDQPYCLYVAFTAPHDPRTPPDAYARRGDTVSLPANFLPIHPFDNGEMLVRDELLEALPRPADAVRQHIADYYGMIAHLDAAIGDILKALANNGDDANTIVVYTADHGLALGQHGLMGKQNLYEHSLHIPLIIAGPDLPRGKRVPHLVWHADTSATLLELAGCPVDPMAEGCSLVPIMSDTEAGWRDTFAAAYRFSQRMIRDSRYKLIRYIDQAPLGRGPYRADNTPSRGSRTEQLFDLVADPGETINLAALPAYAAHRERLARALDAWQQKVGDPLLAAEEGAQR